MPQTEPTLIRTGMADVIASGTVIAFDRHSISVSIVLAEHSYDYPPGPDDRAGRLAINFLFQEDPKPAAPRIEFGPENSREVSLILFNFDDPAGTGNDQPIRLGTVGSKSLYLSFRIYSIQSSPKTLHYTVYLRDDKKANAAEYEAQQRALSR